MASVQVLRQGVVGVPFRSGRRFVAVISTRARWTLPNSQNDGINCRLFHSSSLWQDFSSFVQPSTVLKDKAPKASTDWSISTEEKPFGLTESPRIQPDGDFKDLVTQSTIFADKSLFIKDVMEEKGTVLLLAMPRRWGKSVNLDMLRRFLAVPVDDNGKVIDGTDNDNYKIFRKKCVLQPSGGKSLLKISQSKILVQNSVGDIFSRQEVDALKLQGTYPVIYIDFKDCKSDSFDVVLEGVKEVLNSCFKQHCYLEKSDKLKEQEKKRFKRYLGDISFMSLGRNEVKSGLRFLSRMLYQHYDKKVWILIDEYDAAANVAYRIFTRDDLQTTVNLFAGIFEAALKSNPYLEKGVLTGVQYIAQSGMLSGLNNLRKFNFTNAKYAQHYGLDQGEIEHFFEHFEVPKTLGNYAKCWYNGYKVKKYNGNNKASPHEFVSKYNIWSIVNYLNSEDLNCFKSHWGQSGNVDFLGELFKKKEVREEVEKLIDGECISFERKDDFSAEDFNQLRNMIGGNKEIAPAGLGVLFSYLFIGGYLTIDDRAHASYKLPNMEIMHEMGKRLMTYYLHICKVDPAKIQSVTNVLKDIMGNPNREHMQKCFKDFYDRFKEVIGTVKLVGDTNKEGVFANEDIVHSLLNYIALQTQYNTFGSELYTTKLHSKEKGRADIKITRGDVGVIMEIKCVAVSECGNNHMKEALEQAISYGNLLDTHENLFIVINVDRSMRTSEERPIEILCASAMSDGQHVFGINASGDFDNFGVDNNIMEGFKRRAT